MTNRRKTLRVLLGLGVGLLACAGAYWVATAPQNAATQQASLVAGAPHLDFGEVWEDAAFTWELPIENRGPSDLHIVELRASCGCTTVEPKALDIPSGQTRPVRLTFNLTWIPPKVDEDTSQPLPPPGSSRDFVVSVAAKVEGPEGSPLPTVAWTVKGRVRPVLTVEPRTIGFGDSLVQGGVVASQLVNVTAHAPLTGLDVMCEPDIMTAKLSRLPGEDRTFKLEIQPKNDLQAGSLKSAVVLLPKTDSSSLPRVVIPIEGQIRPVVGVLPQPNDLGSMPVGTRAKATFWVVANRPAPIDTVEVILNDKQARTLQVQKEGDKWRVEVERIIDAPGYGECQGVIHTTPSYASQDEPMIRLRWYGTAP